jgi:hypothetical protein
VLLAADGDALLVSATATATCVGRPWHQFKRQPDDSWLDAGMLPTALTNQPITTPTHGPALHLIAYTANPTTLDEWSNETGTWQLVVQHDVAAMGLSIVQGVALTGDGLRLVGRATLMGQDTMFYADRQRMPDDFTNVQPLVGVPLTYSQLFMTEDCARVYLSDGFTQVFYAQQQ